MKTREELEKAVVDAEVADSAMGDVWTTYVVTKVALIDATNALAVYDKETCHSFVSGADDGGVKCKTHPDAPHGFARNASHNAGRYVCQCEHWEENT
jgi:hypothetical protein